MTVFHSRANRRLGTFGVNSGSVLVKIAFISMLSETQWGGGDRLPELTRATLVAPDLLRKDRVKDEIGFQCFSFHFAATHIVSERL